MNPASDRFQKAETAEVYDEKTPFPPMKIQEFNLVGRRGIRIHFFTVWAGSERIRSLSLFSPSISLPPH